MKKLSKNYVAVLSPFATIVTVSHSKKQQKTSLGLYEKFSPVRPSKHKEIQPKYKSQMQIPKLSNSYNAPGKNKGVGSGRFCF